MTQPWIDVVQDVTILCVLGVTCFLSWRITQLERRQGWRK